MLTYTILRRVRLAPSAYCCAERALVSTAVIGGLTSLMIGGWRMQGADGRLATKVDWISGGSRTGKSRHDIRREWIVADESVYDRGLAVSKVLFYFPRTTSCIHAQRSSVLYRDLFTSPDCYHLLSA